MEIDLLEYRKRNPSLNLWSFGVAAGRFIKLLYEKLKSQGLYLLKSCENVPYAVITVYYNIITIVSIVLDAIVCTLFIILYILVSSHCVLCPTF